LTCGNEVTPTYAGISQGEGGCYTCRTAKIADTLRMDEIDAVAIMRGAGVEPLDPYVNSHTPWRCKCSVCGNEVSPRLTSIQRGQTGCKFCAGKAIDVPRVTEALRQRGFEVLEPITQRKKRVLVHCGTCDQDLTILYDQILSGWSGCPGCTRRVFNRTKPSVLYVLVHDDLLAYKVGIMNADTRRLRQHAQGGWAVLARYGFPDGASARAAEREALRWVREDLRLPPHVGHFDMMYGGFTETFSVDGVDSSTLLRRVGHIAGELGGKRA
jgi:hypothetical protein